MTAPQFMKHARELDAAIQALDRRHLIALVNHAPRETLRRLEAERNELSRRWGAAWHTKPAGLHDADGDSSTVPSSHNGGSEPSL